MSHAADHFRSTHQEDGSVVLDLARGTITTLNPTGGFIWQALQDGMAEKEIVARLAETYPEDAAQIEEDVRLFLSSLADHGLMRGPQP